MQVWFSASDASAISLVGSPPPSILLLFPSLNCRIWDAQMTIPLDQCESLGCVPRDGIMCRVIGYRKTGMDQLTLSAGSFNILINTWYFYLPN